MATLALLLLLLASPAQLHAADAACGASTDVIVHAQTLPPTQAALERAIRRWSRWTARHDDAQYCLTLVLSPVDGSDGEPIVQPVLLIFRHSAPAERQDASPVPLKGYVA